VMNVWFWSTILLAIVVSIDSLGVGITYGMRKLKIPIFALIIIGMCSAALLSISIFAGSVIKNLLHESISSIISGSILFSIGGVQLMKRLGQSFQYGSLPEQGDLLLSLRLKPLGIIVRVFCDPVIADLDSSGHIDLGEAAVLGIALGLDALAVGLGISLADFSLFIIPCVFAACMLFVYLGQLLARIRTIRSISEKWSFAPSLLLVLIGVLRLAHLI
jgi:putative sporulation protein YtaF